MGEVVNAIGQKVQIAARLDKKLIRQLYKTETLGKASATLINTHGLTMRKQTK